MVPEEPYGYQLLPSEEPGTDPGEEPGGHDEEVPAARRPDEGAQMLVRRKVKYDGGVRYDLSRDPFVIHPHTPAVVVWNTYISALLVFDVVYLPLETAFSTSVSREFNFWFNKLSRACFCLDICLQFLLQVPSPTGDYWIFNHRRIVHTYLTGYFLIDLISVLPFSEVYAMASLGGDKGDYLARLLQFLRFLRMVRFRHVIAKYQYDVDLSYLKRTVLCSGAVMLMCVHMMSCIWSTLGNYQDGYNWLSDLWGFRARHGGGEWQDASEGVSGGMLATYLTSTYFALYTLTGIGYGDIVPTTTAEYFFVICMMLLGSLVWATIIGEIVSVIQNANMDEINHQEKMDVVLEMSREYGLSIDLRLRLQSYFRQMRGVRRTAFLQQIVARMNSELAIQFVYVIHDTWLSNIWWLGKVSKSSFVVQLTLEFMPLLYCPKECIMTADRLYVIQRGLCIHGRQVLSKDMCWGTDMLLEQEHLRSNKVTLAISYVHVLYLTRDALECTLARFPEERAEVRKAYRRLVVLRGIIWRAKQIKAERQRRARTAALTQLQPGDSLRDEGPAAPARGSRCGSADLEDRGWAPPVPHDDLEGAVWELRVRLDRLQGEVDQRLDDVGRRVAQAVELLAEAAQARQGKSWGRRVRR